MQLPNLDTLILGTQFVGMELYSVNSEEGVAILNVEKKGGELTITHREKRSSFEKLVDRPNKELPVFLTINNSQVIHKEVEGIESVDSKLLHKAFPNIKTDDFFYQIWRLESKALVAICRKSYVEDLLQQLSEMDIVVSGISIGVCNLSQIIDFVDSSAIRTNSQTLDLESDALLLSSEEGLVKTYDVNGLEIQNTYLLSFSGVLQKIAPSANVSGNTLELNTGLFDAYYQNSFFKKGLRLMVYVLLGILLVNFFFFNHYYKKSVETNADVLAGKEMAQQIKQTKERLKDKESKLKNSTNLFDSKSSFLINELVKNMPNSILLSELTYHPLEKKVKEDEPLVFKSDVILISGKTVNVKELTNWFEAIEENKWVKSTAIVHFGKNETNESVFTLQINLRPNEVK